MTFGTILADPPWHFNVWSRDTGLGRSAESHYQTMTLADLCAMPVQTLAAPNCALFMWATWPTILDAFTLGQAWNFEYKTCAFLWVKTARNSHHRFGFIHEVSNFFMGMGYWTRANTEPCLLFTRGKPKRQSASVRQLLVSPIREHSQKPDEQYALIERLVCGPYVELFARRPWPNWECYGNEVESTVKLNAQS